MVRPLAGFMLPDEPTSNLDSLNETVILKALKEEAGGKTVVPVSHRRSAVRIADEIQARKRYAPHPEQPPSEAAAEQSQEMLRKPLPCRITAPATGWGLRRIRP